jgi:hypothetical protein
VLQYCSATTQPLQVSWLIKITTFGATDKHASVDRWAYLNYAHFPQESVGEFADELANVSGFRVSHISTRHQRILRGFGSRIYVELRFCPGLSCYNFNARPKLGYLATGVNRLLWPMILGACSLALLAYAIHLTVRELRKDPISNVRLNRRHAIASLVDAIAGDFALDRSNYTPGHRRPGYFEIILTNRSVEEVPQARAIVFSGSHGEYFLSDPMAVAPAGVHAPLYTRATGPTTWDALSQVLTTEFGPRMTILIDRVRISGGSKVVLIFRDLDQELYVYRRSFLQTGSDEELHASNFRDPEVFSATEDDPRTYEEQVATTHRTIFDWLSDHVVLYRHIGTENKLKLIACIVGFLATVAVVGISIVKEVAVGTAAHRSIGRYERRSISAYLKPLTGQEITVLVSAKDAATEPAQYAEILSDVLRDAGWRVHSRIVKEAPTPVGLMYWSENPELPALRALLRAFSRSGVEISRIVPFAEVPQVNPPLTFVLLVHRAPKDPAIIPAAH